MSILHQQAVSSQSVERYLLGDLPSPLREEFEDHFFGCPQCAEALRTGAILQENARALLGPLLRLESTVRTGIASAESQANGTAVHESAAGSRIGWMPRFRVREFVPWAAVVFLLFVVFKQRQDFAAPMAKSAIPVTLHSDSRGSASGYPSVLAGGLLSLSVDVPADGVCSWTLRPQEGGSVQLSGSGTAIRGSLVIVVDSTKLAPGTFVVAVAPQSTTPLPDRLYYFELKRAQKD